MAWVAVKFGINTKSVVMEMGKFHEAKLSEITRNKSGGIYPKFSLLYPCYSMLIPYSLIFLVFLCMRFVTMYKLCY